MEHGRSRLARGTGLFKKRILPVILIGILLLSGCGQEEEQPEEVEYGYMVERAQSGEVAYDTLAIGFAVRDGYLYYMDNAFCRVSVEELDFANREELYSMESLLDTAGERIIGFELDENQNLYYAAVSYAESGIAVYKCSHEGERLYRVLVRDEDMQGRSSNGFKIAVDDSGNVYVVSAASILRVDDQGNFAGRIDISDMLSSQFAVAYLIKVSGDGILFFVDDMSAMARDAYKIRGGNSFQLERVETFAQMFRPELYKGLNGLLINDEDVLYRYNEQSDSIQQVLRWEDCDLYAGEVEEVMEIGENRFLVFYNDWSGEVYARKCLILTAVPSDEMPRKEQIVLASLFASDGLKKAVVEFNRKSSQYHVSIQSYGAKSVFENNESSYLRLDNALTSKDGPDLLDLSYMDITKYANVDALDDLYSYMGEDDAWKEEYLANLLEGFTIGGKLVTIPRLFYFTYVLAEEEMVSELEDWSMESIIALSQKHPDAKLLPADMATADYLMGTFCADYYLKKYIDWETGSCDFDGEGFRSLLEWAKGQLRQKGDQEESLLAISFARGYTDYQRALTSNEGKTVLRGFPSAEGERFSVKVLNALGIVSNSGHKEGAWEFMRFFLEQKEEGYGFPTRSQELDAMREDALVAGISFGEDGEILEQRPALTIYEDGVTMDVYAISRKDADTLQNALERIDFVPRSAIEQSVVDIVAEEAEAFLSGTRSVEDVTEHIQNRVSVLVQENR